MARAKTKTKAKPVKAKAKPAPSAKRETSRTKAPTVSQLAETSRTKAPTATDIRSQTRRQRAPTVSERAETARTRAKTERPRTATLQDPPSRRPATDTLHDAPARRPVRDTLQDRPRSDTLRDAPTRRRNETLGEAPILVTAHDEVEGTDLGEVGDPARAAELAALEARIEQITDPDLLVAIASQVDTLGMQLAFEISRHAHDAAHVAPLKPVLIRVPSVYGRALVRAAERFDDRGSPKRAAFVLFEALRKAFDADLIASVSEALAFILEAHGQATPASRLRGLVVERADQRAAGADRKEVRAQFGAALELVRDRGVDWTALDDDPPQFD